MRLEEQIALGFAFDPAATEMGCLFMKVIISEILSLQLSCESNIILKLTVGVHLRFCCLCCLPGLIRPHESLRVR